MFAKFAQWRAAHAGRAARAGYAVPANDNRRPPAANALRGTYPLLICRWHKAEAGAALTCAWGLEGTAARAGHDEAKTLAPEPSPRRHRAAGRWAVLVANHA
jgi:hypothetical protein